MDAHVLFASRGDFKFISIGRLKIVLKISQRSSLKILIIWLYLRYFWIYFTCVHEPLHLTILCRLLCSPTHAAYVICNSSALPKIFEFASIRMKNGLGNYYNLSSFRHEYFTFHLWYTRSPTVIWPSWLVTLTTHNFTSCGNDFLMTVY